MENESGELVPATHIAQGHGSIYFTHGRHYPGDCQEAWEDIQDSLLVADYYDGDPMTLPHWMLELEEPFSGSASYKGGLSRGWVEVDLGEVYTSPAWGAVAIDVATNILQPHSDPTLARHCGRLLFYAQEDPESVRSMYEELDRMRGSNQDGKRAAAAALLLRSAMHVIVQGDYTVLAKVRAAQKALRAAAPLVDLTDKIRLRHVVAGVATAGDMLAAGRAGDNAEVVRLINKAARTRRRTLPHLLAHTLCRLAQERCIHNSDVPNWLDLHMPRTPSGSWHDAQWWALKASLMRSPAQRPRRDDIIDCI